MKTPTVYIATSKSYGTLYIGVTSDLHQRMAQHSQGLLEGFTKRYGMKLLVYFEMHETMPDAILREKQIKKWSRAWKIRLIEQMNPEWKNLFDPATGAIDFGSSDVGAWDFEQVPNIGSDGSPPSRG